RNIGRPMAAAVISLLDALETELKQQYLWCMAPADPKAMASTMPFCYDTMPLEHWLQDVFLPRMRDLLVTGSPLPTGFVVLPIAEMAFQPKGSRVHKLLQIIAQLDNQFGAEK